MLKWMTVVVMMALGLTGANAQSMSSSHGPLKITKVASGFKTPWALGFLPNGAFLVTERRGRLYRVTQGGSSQRIRGVPDVAADGQGGLLDVLVPRDYAQRQEIFLTFSKRQASGSGTAVARATLRPGADRLENLTVIFEMTAGSRGGRHFGSRLVEARDGTLFVSIGDRGDRPSAQDISRHNGSILRITRDGKPAPGNPFAATNEAEPEIWSYGHRNPQGMALDGTGQLWAVEHGARGGDEVNRIGKGANFGWPVIAYGRHYSGGKIGEGTQKPGMKQPEFYWDPSIAPSGMMIYSGNMFEKWQDHKFVGSLKFDYISRLSGSNLTEVERLKSPETKRVRDIRRAPDGSIWFISEDRGAVYQLSR